MFVRVFQKIGKMFVNPNHPKPIKQLVVLHFDVLSTV